MFMKKSWFEKEFKSLTKQEILAILSNNREQSNIIVSVVGKKIEKK